MPVDSGAVGFFAGEPSESANGGSLPVGLGQMPAEAERATVDFQRDVPLPL